MTPWGSRLSRYPSSARQLPPDVSGHPKIGPGCHSQLCQQPWLSRLCSVTAPWGSRWSRYPSSACQLPPDVSGHLKIGPGCHSHLCQQPWLSKHCSLAPEGPDTHVWPAGCPLMSVNLQKLVKAISHSYASQFG